MKKGGRNGVVRLGWVCWFGSSVNDLLSNGGVVAVWRACILACTPYVFARAGLGPWAGQVVVRTQTEWFRCRAVVMCWRATRPTLDLIRGAPAGRPVTICVELCLLFI